MARDTLYAIGEALIDMIPPGAAAPLPMRPPLRPAWGCKTLPVQNIFAWNVHFCQMPLFDEMIAKIL